MASLSAQAQATDFVWLSGTYLAAGLPMPLSTGDRVTATGAAAKSFSADTVLAGDLIWASTSNIGLSGTGTTVRNNGNFTVTGDGQMRALAPSAVFDNAGTLRKSAGSGDLLLSSIVFNRTGATLQADSGRIVYEIGSTFESGSIFAGTGQHVLRSAGTFNFSGPFTAANDNVRFERGTFINTGTSPLAPATNLTWSGGTLRGGWANASGRTLTAVDGLDKTFGSDFTNNGNIVWANTNDILLDGIGTTVRNNGSFTVTSDGQMRALAPSAAFDNAGTLRKSAGSGDLLLSSIVFNRTGATLQADSGRIVYEIGSTFESGSIFAGTGQHVLRSAGTFNFSGPFAAANDNVRFERGTFFNTGTSPLAPATNLTWSGGTLRGGWANASGRTLTAVDGLDKTFGSDFTNNGNIVWANTNDIRLDGTGTTVRNNGNFTVTGDGQMRALAPSAAFDNAGTLRKSAGSGELLITANLINTGTIESLSGAIHLADGWRNDGTLRGTASFMSGRLVNAGTIAPGQADGDQTMASLTLTGSLDSTAAGRLTFDVGSGGAADLLSITGLADIDGVLVVSRTGGYTPVVGDRFRVINYASHTGVALAVESIGFASGVSFYAEYAADHLDVVVGTAPVPEPSTLLLMAIGVLGLLAHRRRGSRVH